MRRTEQWYADMDGTGLPEVAVMTGNDRRTELRLPLTGVQEPIGRGRDFVREALAAWQRPAVPAAAAPSAASDAVLVVSELLTNACLHGKGPRELVVLLSDAVLRVEVSDFEASAPELRSPHRPG
ncbi:hypothetical protein ACFQ9X_38910 [Catenulispora yoronensis]